MTGHLNTSDSKEYIIKKLELETNIIDTINAGLDNKITSMENDMGKMEAMS